MGFRMYSHNQQHEDFKLIDNLVTEQFTIGGVDMWVYSYEGPASTPESDDETKPDFIDGSDINDIGNAIWGENAKRTYSKDAVVLPFSYQQSDATLEMQIPGLFLFETLDVELPYTMMIKRVGRKIINGDVVEMPHYRDDELTNSDDAINRFYVVHDAFFSAGGYSPIYTRHIWKLRLVPLTNSPEFSDLLGDPNDEDSIGNQLSSNEKELEIMDAIISQADSEVPYLHWDNEQVFTNEVGDEKGETTIKGTHDNQREGLPPSDYTEVTAFPMSPVDGEWVLRIDMKVPLFFQWDEDNSTWRQFVYGGRQPYVGPDWSQADLINNDETFTDSEGASKQSRQSIHDVIKPDIDDI